VTDPGSNTYSPADARPEAPRGPLARSLMRVVDVRPEEISALLRSLAYFFLLFASYYILRPVREEISSQDRDNLSKLWTATFFVTVAAVPLYSAVVARYPRRVFIPRTNRFFIANLLIFFVLLLTVEEGPRIWAERAFYVWFNVYNLFVVSVAWSLMADVFRNEQSKRLFGFIALGATLGGVAGSGLTSLLVAVMPPPYLILVSVALLELATWFAGSLARKGVGDRERAQAAAGQATADADRLIGGGILDGIRAVFRSPYLSGICAYLFLYTLVSTFAYQEQAHIIGEALPDRAARTVLYARIDLAVNVLTGLAQAFVTGRLIKSIGVGATLMILPAVAMVGFAGLGAAPILVVLVVFQVTRRAANFALAKPSREVLFTVVGRVERFKSKSFVDTVVYRGGDMVNAWLFDGLRAMGLGFGAIAFAAIPAAGAWLFTGLALGRAQERRAAAQAAAPAEDGAGTTRPESAP